ncbi:hypothetical protein [Microcoleus sp. FACHB-672]|nr:hypothetical protein [Microcoleus sp. FACHB-672]MBD2043976.1 hypothetical protein [Microcoleus sp. FACHB-672]
MNIAWDGAISTKHAPREIDEIFDPLDAVLIGVAAVLTGNSTYNSC